ncbi:MAG: hypothetical protein EBR82_83860, partial [Caulobacteraceae bacterium]|nr:hypothetical protein [Caulobacteraceae bacterium]
AALDDLQTLNERYKPGSYEAQALAKYADYTIPGGENYREILLRLPTETADEYAQKMYKKYNGPWIMKATEEELDKYGSLRDKGPKIFKSRHWDQPNVISHIRMNDRTDAEGKKVLFIEELQSDWGQEGRKKGFGPREMQYQVANQNGIVLERFSDRQQAKDFIQTLSASYPNSSFSINEIPTGESVPSAPFVQNTKDWVDLSLKNILKRAVDEGYDRVAFINGKQSADRYQLTKYLDKLEFIRTSGGIAPGPNELGNGMLIGYDKSGHRIIEELQSDWAQEGRKKGFANLGAVDAYEEYIKDLKSRAAERLVKDFTDEGVSPDRANKLANRMKNRMMESDLAKLLGETPKFDELFKAKRAAEEGVPSAPFVQNTKDWVDLSLKNILK